MLYFTGTLPNSDSKPRACILTLAHLNAFKLTQFCDRDMVTISVDDSPGKKLIFCTVAAKGGGQIGQCPPLGLSGEGIAPPWDIDLEKLK